jgi:uncharacterized alpha-E superfamily protein
MAGAMLNRLSSARIGTIMKEGLHEFILDMVVENNRLGAAIADQYLG